MVFASAPAIFGDAKTISGTPKIDFGTARIIPGAARIFDGFAATIVADSEIIAVTARIILASATMAEEAPAIVLADLPAAEADASAEAVVVCCVPIVTRPFQSRCANGVNSRSCRGTLDSFVGETPTNDAPLWRYIPGEGDRFTVHEASGNVSV